MFDLLFAASLIGSCVQLIKEAKEPVAPAKNLVNKTYPEPHRDENGKIIIENSLLYKEDVRNYGAVQAQKWVKQGKYNLTPEELKKEHERIKADFERMYSLL
jgi:hypothetical protein